MTILSGSWNNIPPLDEARSHPAVVTFQGQIYTFGGGGPNFKSLDSTVVFNPKTNQWTSRAPMPTKRSGTAAFCIDNAIYIIGGGYKKPDGNFQFLTTVEIYYPETDTWEAGPSMLQPHDYPAAIFHDDYIYILGGHHPNACLGGPKTDPGFEFCERWKPGMTQWEKLADLSSPRFAASGFVFNNKLNVAGGIGFRKEGFNNFDFIETLDPGVAQAEWRMSENFKLPWPAAGQGMCIAQEHLFFFGGYSTENIHDRASVMPENDGTWITLPNMPMARAAMGVSICENSIYLIGGWADDGRTPLSSAVKYSWK